jgi:hypothetical protein
MVDLCLSSTVTSVCVLYWESLSLMIIGVSRWSLRKTYFKPRGRGFNSIGGHGGTSKGSSSIGSASPLLQ